MQSIQLKWLRALPLSSEEGKKKKGIASSKHQSLPLSLGGRFMK